MKKIITIVIAILIYAALTFAQQQPDSTLYYKYLKLQNQYAMAADSCSSQEQLWRQMKEANQAKAVAMLDLFREEKTKLDSLNKKESKK